MWATVEDIHARWLTGEVPATDAQLATLIEDAEDIIASEYPRTETDVTLGVVPGARVVRVVSRMVNRVLRNPDGLRQVQDSTGPFSSSMTYGGDHPGELYLTDDDRRDLGGRKAKGKAYTLSTIPQGWR